VHESILIPSFFRPACTAHTVAVLLHDYWAIYDPPSTSLLYATHHTILVITISCRDQSPMRASFSTSPSASELSLYKILFHFKASLFESIILLCPPPTCNAYPIAVLLRDHCAIYPRLPTPPFYAIHHTILVMATSCKGQMRSPRTGFSGCVCGRVTLPKLRS